MYKQQPLEATTNASMLEGKKMRYNTYEKEDTIVVNDQHHSWDTTPSITGTADVSAPPAPTGRTNSERKDASAADSILKGITFLFGNTTLGSNRRKVVCCNVTNLRKATTTTTTSSSSSCDYISSSIHLNHTDTTDQSITTATSSSYVVLPVSYLDSENATDQYSMKASKRITTKCVHKKNLCLQNNNNNKNKNKKNNNNNNNNENENKNEVQCKNDHFTKVPPKIDNIITTKGDGDEKQPTSLGTTDTQFQTIETARIDRILETKSLKEKDVCTNSNNTSYSLQIESGKLVENKSSSYTKEVEVEDEVAEENIILEINSETSSSTSISVRSMDQYDDCRSIVDEEEEGFCDDPLLGALPKSPRSPVFMSPLPLLQSTTTTPATTTKTPTQLRIMNHHSRMMNLKQVPTAAPPLFLSLNNEEIKTTIEDVVVVVDSAAAATTDDDDDEIDTPMKRRSRCKNDYDNNNNNNNNNININSSNNNNVINCKNYNNLVSTTSYGEQHNKQYGRHQHACHDLKQQQNNDQQRQGQGNPLEQFIKAISYWFQ